jgi:hypothetical protein
MGGDDLGGGDDGGGLGGDDLGGDEEGEEEEPDTGDLLAAPAKRETYTTPGAKGKMYTKVTDDTRDMGARKRSIRSKWAYDSTQNTRQNTFKGLGDLLSLGKGISETIYGEEDEKLLMEVNRELSSQEIQSLINGLDSKLGE